MSSKDPRYVALVNCQRWRRLRAWQLSHYPLCERCETLGIKTLATVVHHIDPVEDCHTQADMEARCYNRANLMSLCADCHRTVHDGYHTAAAIRKRNDQRSERSIDTLAGWRDDDYTPARREKSTLPSWSPPTK